MTNGTQILQRAISSMLEELEPNLFEENLARKVDFGHTFSYGLETRAQGKPICCMEKRYFSTSWSRS